jgi:hypothetical protein
MTDGNEDELHKSALFGLLREQFRAEPETEKRRQREQAATGGTRRRAPPKVQIGARVRADVRDLLDALHDHHGGERTMGQLIEDAIRALAKATPGFQYEAKP